MRIAKWKGLLVLAMYASAALAADDTVSNRTYAERLGWPQGTRALILHVDDAGMSAESNQGAIHSIDGGVANSMSVMMPTPWVPEIVRYIKSSGADAGLHLTLNAEWKDYRWGPVAGKAGVPGLVDPEGALWHSVEQVVAQATADEVGREIAAQLDRALVMGFAPTHLDSHMGTLFAKPEFLAKYIELGVRHKIPVMFPGGHNFFARQQYSERAAEEAQATGEAIWAAGLPVLDDLHNASYDWPRAKKVANYSAAVRKLKPGVTMMIMHSSAPSRGFPNITDSAESRYGDLEAMRSRRFARVLAKENIVLTTWRELMQRRVAAE